jgi:hypothetical protein
VRALGINKKSRQEIEETGGERGWSSSNRTIRETDAALPIEPSKRFPFGTEKTVASFAQTQQSRAKSNLTHRAASALPQEGAYIWRAETTAVSAADSATPPTRTRDPSASTSVASPLLLLQKEILLPFPFRGPCSSSPTDGLPTTATRLNPNPRFFWADRGGGGEDVGEAGALEHSQEPQGEDPLPPSPAPSHLAVAARLTGALSAAPQFMQRAAAAQKAEVEVEAAAQVVAATDGGSGPSPQVRRKWYGDRKSRFFLLPFLLV